MTSGLVHGVRLAARGLVRRPGYSVPVIMTVALGIAAVTTMFGVVYSVVLRPLPYPDEHQLVEVFPSAPERDDPRSAFSLPDLTDWKERNRRLAALGGFTTLPSDLVFTEDGQAAEVPTAFVTSGFFEALGVAPEVGRWPTAEEEEGDNRVLVLSNALWMERFGGDPAVVSRTVDVSGQVYRVAGVMPADFAFPSPSVDAWAFISTIPGASIPFEYRGLRLLRAVGRVVDGATLNDVAADLSGVATGLAAEYPDFNEGLTSATIEPLRTGVIGNADRSLLLLLAAAVGTLVVVCANVGNLALAREARRTGDLAVRTALGASRATLVGIVVTEGLLLSMVGGAMGMVMAGWTTRLISTRAVEFLPRAGEVSVHWPVALVAMLASITVGLVCSMLPGLRAGRASVAGTLRASGRSVTGRGGRLLVAAQVAVAVVVVAGAGLLGRGLQALAQVSPGFEPENLVVADITFPASRYQGRPDYLPRFDQTLEAFAAVPGVRAVGSIRRFPLLGEGESVEWSVPGGVAQSGPPTYTRMLQVAGDAFGALGATLIEGVGLEDDDPAGGRPTLVINTTLAREAFPSTDAVVGRILHLGDNPFEVVGVVEDIAQDGLDRPVEPTVYISHYRSMRRGAAFLLRFDGDEGSILRSVRDVVRTADPEQAITVLAPAQQIVGAELLRPRFFVGVMAALALLVLVLVGVGVYGVVAFGVAQRRREVGIRMAVGATAESVTALVVRQGMVPVVFGVALGVVAALALSRLATGMLYGVPPTDPVSYGAALSVLVGVGLLACWVPGRRASRTSPTVALAAE